MLKIKEKWHRLRRRQPPEESNGKGTRRGLLKVLRLRKLGFLSKLKKGHKPNVEVNERPPTPETPDVTEDGGIEDTKSGSGDVWCGGHEIHNDNKSVDGETKDYFDVKERDSKLDNDIEMNGDIGSNDNIIRIEVECHDTEENQPFIRAANTPDRASKSSFGSGLLSVSRTSMSGRSLSNLSVGSSRSIRYKDMRTVWTQISVLPGMELNGFESQDISTGLAVELSTAEPSLNSSIDFGIEDAINDIVANEKLLEVKNKILQCLIYPDLTDCEVSLCVDMIKISKVPFLVALNKKILRDEGYFNEEFIMSCGIDMLFKELDRISVRGLTDLADVTKAVLISECVAVLFNSESGRKFIMENGEHIACVAKAQCINKVRFLMRHPF
ncbi:Inverted formin-2 [Mactra antiquata]